jgi:hypothetical protein
MSLFAYLISFFREVITSHFLLLWLFSLVGIVVGGYWISRMSVPTSLAKAQGYARYLRLTSTDIAGLSVFGLFLLLYTAMILYKEDFVFFDNDQLTDFSVAGRALPPPIWPLEGRFFPLALQEFNALRFITRSPMGYQLFAVVQLLIVLLLLSFVLREFRISYRLLALAALMLAPAFSISFTGLVYSERDVVFWLVILLICLLRYSKTCAPSYFVACLVCAHFALYYKETIVVLIAGFAVCYLLFQLYGGLTDRNRSWRGFFKQNSLYIGLLAVCATYVAFYVVAMFPWGHSAYVAEHSQPIGSVLQTYLVIDWLPWILLAVFLLRLVRLLNRTGGLDTMWDSLAAAALAYFFIVVGLRLISGYYMAPVDLIASVYLARLAFAWLTAARKAHVALAVSALVCLLIHDAAYSSFRIIERKSMIMASRRFADFLQSYSRDATDSTIDLYFPYATGHQLATLSAYLRYRDLPLAETGLANGRPGPRLRIEGAGEFTGNRCMEYSAYTCVHADTPIRGALVVVMPDDFVRMSDVSKLARDSAMLLQLKTPGLVADNSWLRLLYVVSPEFAATGLPEHWLQLDIFQTGEAREKRAAVSARNQLASISLTQ